MQTYSEYRVNSEYIFKQNPESKLKPYVQGSFNAQFLPLFTSFLMTMTIVVTYIIAVYQGDVQPFPYTDITHTSRGYPQYIYSRITGLCQVPLIFICILMEYWHLSNIIKFHTNFDKRRAPISIVVLGFAACCLLALCHSSIDQNQMNWALHVLGATGYTIMIYINFIIITCTMHKIRKYAQLGCKLISDKVYYIKLAVILALTLLLILDIYNKFKPINSYMSNVCEWAGCFLVIVYIASFFHDFENFDFGLEKPVKKL